MAGKNIIDQMLKISKAVLKAKNNLAKTVEYSREDILDEGAEILKKEPTQKFITFGVKNTNQIDRNIVHKLVDRGYLFHTIDTMALGGRAIDVDILNPLTANVMTGSTSGGCVNILLGINDFALGTDGGGSVLAPAMSTGLYSIMGKGLGLRGVNERISTDRISFLPGIGVISHDYSLCIDVIESLVDLPKKSISNISIAIPKEKTDKESIKKILPYINGRIKEVKFEDLNGRQYMIDRLNDLFNKGVDIIITEEGPVDIKGYGDSVLGVWGDVGGKIQSSSGKELLKVVNMVNGTGITIPTGDLGKGIVIIAKEGLKYGAMAIEIGKTMVPLFPKPNLFREYFIEGYKKPKGGFI